MKHAGEAYAADADLMAMLRKLREHGFGGCTVGDLIDKPTACAMAAERTQVYGRTLAGAHMEDERGARCIANPIRSED